VFGDHVRVEPGDVVSRYRIATRDEDGEAWLEECRATGATVFIDAPEEALDLSWTQAVALLWWLQGGGAFYLDRVADTN
jgi:hypothetical protein